MRDLPSKPAAQEFPIRDGAKPSTNANHDDVTDTTESEPSTVAPDNPPRQDPALQAFLAKQRAAMGFT